MLKNSIHFFTNIGPNLSKKISQISKTFDKYFSPVDTQINNRNLTLRKFETANKSLKRRKASGIDVINSSNTVLDLFEEFKISLFYLYLFLDKLEIAKVGPTFKGGNNLQAANYRPISVLPVISKILEKKMYNRLYNYFVANKFLFPKQFGFPINTLTEDAILELIRNITKFSEKTEYVLRVFIDYKEAFDTVNHAILEINSTCLEWFKSYLQTEINESSKTSIITSKYLSTKISSVMCPRNPSWASCSS